jgi:hypothetical protein
MKREKVKSVYKTRDILDEDPPLVIVECACGANTVARTPISITLENWRVEWPEQTFKMMRVRGVCPKCLNRQA